MHLLFKVAYKQINDSMIHSQTLHPNIKLLKVNFKDMRNHWQVTQKKC